MSFLNLIACIGLSLLPCEQSYLKGWEAERDGRYDAALKAFSVCLSGEGPLTPYAAVHAAFCKGKLSRKEEAVKQYSAIIEKAPEEPWADMARVQLAALLMDMDRHKEASELYGQILNLKPNPWWFEDFEWQAAENLFSDEKTRGEAMAFYRDILSNTIWRHKRLRAAKFLAQSDNPDDAFSAAMAMARSRAFTDASKLLASLAPKVLKDRALAADWQALAAQILMGTGKADKGREMMSSLSEKHKGTKWERFALYRGAENLAANKHFGKARVACDRLASKYPKSSETGNALWRLAKNLDAEQKNKEAVTEYLRIVRLSPKHSRADDALFEAANLRLAMRDPKNAQKLFNRLIGEYASSPFAHGAYYWSGRIHEVQGEKAQAVEMYKKAWRGNLGNFYSHRSLERLHRLGHPAKASGRRLKAGRTSYFLRTAKRDEPLNKDAQLAEQMELLAFFGAHGMREGEWETLALLRGESPIPYEELGEAGMAFSARKHASAAKWGLSKRGVPTDARYRVWYPRAYWPHVAAAAKEADVDPYLLLSIALRESTFRPAIMSNAGAAGTMQVMPSTAKWLAQVEPAIKKSHAAHPEHPINSLRMGAHYLKRMLKRSEGNIVYALASYNAGPGNLDKWTKKYRTDDLDYFIESIPYTETREYIKAVLGNYAAYHSLYPPEDKE